MFVLEELWRGKIEIKCQKVSEYKERKLKGEKEGE